MKSFISAAAVAVMLSSSLSASASSEAPAFEPLPLQGHTQSLNFSVETGTWMSVDATPDGQQLVFDLLGDLYTVPATGGTAVALTHGLPFDSQPRISPDGQWLAFVSDRDGDDNLWVMRRADGQLRRLSQVHGGFAISPSWTPDSKQVLVAESLAHLPPDSTFRLYSLSGEATDVKDKDGKPIIGSGGILSRDGQYLYFAHRAPGDEGRYGMPIAQIRRLHLSRGTVETLTNGQGGGTRPALSANGKRLLYATREEGKTVLRERDLESGADRLVTRAMQQDRQDYGRGLRGDHLPGYVLRDSDQSLLLSSGGKLRRIGLRDGQVTEIPFRADVALDVGPRLHKPYRVEQGPLTARIVQSPSFSPDGQHLAMSILTKLYVMPARAGASPKRVTKGDALEYQPVWSPDGKWLAYIVWSREGGHIWKVRADGRDAQRVTAHPAFYTDLVFSPDGQRILALRGSELMWTNMPESANFRLPLDLVWLPIGGGSVQTIATGYPGRNPHFSSDPERIYTTDGHALYSIRYDGSEQRTHIKLSGRFEPRDNSQPTAERFIVSLDGREALAIINKQVWRLPLPPQGEPNVKIDAHAGSPGAIRLTDVGADFFGWAQGGKSIYWAVGSTVYRVATDKAASVASVSAGLREAASAVESYAVQLRVPRAAPKGSLVLRGADVIPMTAAKGATVLQGADIVITDNRIVSVGPVGSVTIPSDARIVDLAGKYIVPGFIDTHAHWKFASREIQDPDNWSLRINLAYGVTAGLDVQSNHGENFIYQDMVETGQTLGTRAFMVGPGVFGINNYKTFENDFQSYEETLAYLRRYQQHYRTHNIKVYLVGNRRQREWVVQACQELGLIPTTEGFGDPFMDLSHAIDGMHGSEHAMLDSALYDDVVQTFARTQTTYTPTLNITHYGLAGAEYFFAREDLQNDVKLNRFYPRNRLLELTNRRSVWASENEFSFRVMAAQAAKIQRAGGLVGVGSHGELQGRGYHWEMEMMARGGMQPDEILRAATIDGAKIIGIEQDLGSLEAGKLADLVVLRANPLQTMANAKQIAYVMQNGVLYDGETLSVDAPSAGAQRPASTDNAALPRRPN